VQAFINDRDLERLFFVHGPSASPVVLRPWTRPPHMHDFSAELRTWNWNLTQATSGHCGWVEFKLIVVFLT
jgi:hypothetical protein